MYDPIRMKACQKILFSLLLKTRILENPGGRRQATKRVLVSHVAGRTIDLVVYSPNGRSVVSGSGLQV